jgi:hypothetical protein
VVKIIRKLPAYRYIPGRNPHPRRSPEGHSFGKKEEKPPYLPPDRWRENEVYLFGIELYENDYFWESHELWESLWHLTKKEDAEGQFLQGLIQNAAAQLKIVAEQWDGARHLSQEAYRRLCFTRDSIVEKIFMGLDLPTLLKEMEKHYGLLWNGEEKISGMRPCLYVSLSG